jgi:VWFA-related protein
MKVSRFLTLLLAFAFTAHPSPSQTTSPQPPANPNKSVDAPASAPDNDGGTLTFHSNVPLVVLDLVVTDAHGTPVTNLTQADFHVQEAGEPQTILNFEQAGARVPSPAVNIDSTADLDRIAPHAPVQIIVLDEFNTRFEDMAFARYSLKKFLNRQPAKLGTPTMLVAVDLRHFTVLHDYTQNKDDIVRALDHHFVAYPWQVHQGAWIAERYATAFFTLRRVAQAVMGHPGHKNMIWIGRGFPPYNLVNAPVDTANRLNNAVQDCVNVLRDARVTLYTIDPAGVLSDPGKYGEDARFNDPLGGNYQFAELARATGGTALYGRNDVDTEINTAIQDGSSFYTVTYRPTNSSLDPQKFRKITVTLDRPGLKVLTRQGYFLRYGPDRVDPEKPSRRLVADLVSADSSNMVYDGVPFTVTRSTEDPQMFVVHIESKGLYWTPATDTETRHTDFIMLVSMFDKKGIELHRDAKTYKIGATGDVPAMGPLDRNIEIKYHFDPDPKAVRARFTVRVTASGRIGTQDATLSASR